MSDLPLGRQIDHGRRAAYVESESEPRLAMKQK